jgi:tRNA(Ile)-lysidine synthase
MTPAAPLIERFRADLETHAGAPGALGIAVSGGPDSLALLLLAKAAYPEQVHAATVDHGLRPESAGEARHVAAICAGLGCPHETLEADVAAGGEGVQGEARRVRYAALAGWAEGKAIGLVCTAHHQEDQAETLLMRLQRGSGLSGLAGIRPSRPEGSVRILRPLLTWSRAELAGIAAAAGLEPVADPSNLDERFDRVALRRFLADNPRFEPARLARSAAALREADEALAWAADELAEDRTTSQGGEWRLDAGGLPRALQRRLLSRTIARVREACGIGPAWTGAEDVERLLKTLEAGGTATLGGVMASGGPVWRIRPAPPRRGSS